MEPEISMNNLDNQFNISNNKVEIDLAVSDNYPKDEPLRRCPDISKISSQLGYKSEVGADEE